MDTRLILPLNTILDGAYRIVQVVGLGGFGITYEAEDINLATRVAIKEYYPVDFADRDATMSVRPKSDRHKKTFDWGRSNFLQEARTLARFEHPSIVRVTRVFEANSTAYMVMRFERGMSFEAWLISLGRPPTQEELDWIVTPLLDALEAMHAADFLHRDIAPDNIIIRPDGTPVLLDFGAARRAVAVVSHTLTGIVKAGYSPHEQYSSDGRLQGPWSDFYALGGTLYRAVVGTSPEEAMMRVDVDQMVPAVKAAKGDYRRSFLMAIDACLKVKQAERPRSVAELRPMFLAGKDESGGKRNRLVEGPNPSQANPPKTSKPKQIDAPAQPRGKSRWPAVAAAILAVVGGAYGGYQYTLWQPSDRGDAEVEAARRSLEVAQQRQASLEAERKRQEEEANKRRLAALEAERKRQDEEANKRRLAALESERKRQEEEANKRRQAALEAERRRQEEEANRRRQAALDAEHKHQEEEAAKRRQAAEAEGKRQEEEAAKRRQAEIEAERRGEAEAEGAARKSREAEARDKRKKEEERIALLPPDEAGSSDVLIPRQDGAITAVAVDGQWMAIGTEKGTVQLWQLSEGLVAKRVGSISLHAGARISAIALGQDDGVKIAASDIAGKIAFWVVQSDGIRRAPAPGQDKRVFALHFHAATKQFMGISVVRAKGNTYAATVERWRPDGRLVEEAKPIDVGGRPIEAGAFAPNDGLFAVVASPHRLLVLGPDRNTPVLAQSFAGFAHALAFSPDGHRVAAAGQFEQIKIWEDMPGKRFGHLIELDLKPTSGQRAGDPSIVTALAFSADGRFIASANLDDKVVLWDTQSPHKPQEYDGRRQLAAEPIKWISLLQSSPGKTVLVMPWDDGTIRRLSVGAGGYAAMPPRP